MSIKTVMSMGGSCPGIARHVHPCLDHFTSDDFVAENPVEQSLMDTLCGRGIGVPSSRKSHDRNIQKAVSPDKQEILSESMLTLGWMALCNTSSNDSPVQNMSPVGKNFKSQKKNHLLTTIIH